MLVLLIEHMLKKHASKVSRKIFLKRLKSWDGASTEPDRPAGVAPGLKRIKALIKKSNVFVSEL